MTRSFKEKGQSFDSEITVDLPNDVDSLDDFKRNLKLGALDLQKDCALPLRSIVRVKFTLSGNPSKVSLLAEVEFEADHRVGLQVIDLTEENSAELTSLLTLAKSVKSEEKPKPPPQAISIEKEGNLDFDIAAALWRVAKQAPYESWAGRTKLIHDTVPGLVVQLNATKFTGILDVTEDATKQKASICFKDGLIVGASEDPISETETVAYRLRKDKKITESDYREVRRLLEETGKSEGFLLMGKVDKKELVRAIRNSIYHQLGSCFGMKAIHYRIRSEPSLLKETLLVPVSVYRAIFRGLQKAAALFLTEELSHGLDPFLNHYVCLKEDLPFPIKALNFSSLEKRFLEVTLERPIRLRKLFAVGALSKIQSLRFIYALYFCGFIDFVTRYVPPPEEFLPHLDETLRELESYNSFDVLQVHWAALGPEIKEHYEKICEEWSTLTYPKEIENEVKEIVGKILKITKEAFSKLSEDESRREYRDQVIDLSQQKFAADLLAQHAKTELFRKERDFARDHINQAIDLNPKKQEYRQILQDCGSKH